MKSLANKFDLDSPSSTQQIFNGFIDILKEVLKEEKQN
jgi:hypothetical protein